MGEGSTKTFHKYHRVLSQVEWSTLQASRLLLNQLVSVFIGLGPIVVGIDETIERGWGPQIKARGIYRDAVRSTHKQIVKCSGLRWVSVMLLCWVPWAGRVWALPFLTALAPSETYYKDKARAHKTLTDWARQLLLVVKRWLPDRQVIAVGDGSYAVIDLWLALQGQVSLISRLRLDAALYGPVPPRPGVSGWYVKKQLTFSDALAGVRSHLWGKMNFIPSGSEVVEVKMSQQQYQLWQEALAWAA